MVVVVVMVIVVVVIVVIRPFGSQRNQSQQLYVVSRIDDKVCLKVWVELTLDDIQLMDIKTIIENMAILVLTHWIDNLGLHNTRLREQMRKFEVFFSR